MIFYVVNILVCVFYYYSVLEVNNNFFEFVCIFLIITLIMSGFINFFKNRNECNI